MFKIIEENSLITSIIATFLVGVYFLYKYILLIIQNINNYKSYIIIVVIVFFILSLILTFIYISDDSSKVPFSSNIKGDGRWASNREIKKELKKVNIKDDHYKYGGIPLKANAKTIWVDNSDSHTLIIGSTGSGKTRRFINPTVNILAKASESMIITDPKRELYEQTGDILREKGYDVIVLNFRDPHLSNTWNPLTIPYELYKSGNIDKSIEFLEDLSINIFYSDYYSNMNPNVFKEKLAADFFCGLCLYLFEDGKSDEINLNSINNMCNEGEGNYLNSTYMFVYFKCKGVNNPAYSFVSSTLMASEELKSDVTALFKQKIRTFTSRKSLSNMLSYSDFDLRKIGSKKTAVFIIVHDEKTTYHALVSIFVKQCYEVVVDYATYNGGKLDIRLNFLLDEFANMPAIKDFTAMITASRSRRIRFFMIIQSFSQLDMIYKYEPAEIIKGNSSNIIYLLSNENKALETISSLCGDKTIRDKDGRVLEKKKLITINDLQRMKIGNAIILKHRIYPFASNFPDQSKYKFYKKLNKKTEFVLRKEKDFRLFSIIDYVENSIDKLMV